MLRLIRRHLGQYLIESGSDSVIAGVEIPPGGSLNAVHLQVSLNASSVFTSGNLAAMYGITGYVIPILDPDSAPTYDAVWDAQVPKDVDEGVNAFDLDTTAADLSPEFEWGEMDITSIIQMSSAPVEVFRRRKLLTVAESMGAMDVATFDWLPIDKFTTTLKRNVRVNVPSVMLLGFSSPSLDDTTATLRTVLSESEWARYMYLGLVVDQSLNQLIGLVEAGAETPYAESAALVAKLLEPPAYEETADAFTSPSWQVWCKATFDVSVPGYRSKAALTSE